MNLPFKPYYRFLFPIGIFLLIVPTLLRNYLLMPFPGSQDLEAMTFVYYLEKSLLLIRILGFLMILFPLLNSFYEKKIKSIIWKTLLCLVCIVINYFSETIMTAENMFKESETLTFTDVNANNVLSERIIIGIENNGVSKAYPLNFIGYHHKIQDEVGGKPVLVTYCTMCRSARVFSPIINGIRQKFRLVGARHYNAVMEDEETKSWWHQESGEAAVGERKGILLEELNYEQMTLSAWIDKHPQTLILQSNPKYLYQYNGLEGYDRNFKRKSDTSHYYEKWQDRNWVIGLQIADSARAYEWKDIIEQKIINDKLNSTSLIIAIENDSLSYHIWSRNFNNEILEFTTDSLNRGIRDKKTFSLWDWKGECVDGNLKGNKLTTIQTHQEYWRSWKTFHKNTSRYLMFE